MRLAGAEGGTSSKGPGHEIEARVVVNCAGMWARQIAEEAGVVVPNQAAEHYYLVTDAIPEVDPSWPVVEDPSSYTYIRPEGGGLMVGLFEAEAAAWNVGRVPDDFSFGEISPDWERMAPFLEKAMGRVPASLEVGAKNFFCGPESFTPDLSPVLGEAPELGNFFVAAGMNSIGILTGGGIGHLMAQWILEGRSQYDITGMNIDRFQPFHANPDYRAHRVVESLGLVYKLHYPNYSMRTARGNKRSPLHDRLVQRGAFFRDVSGWEGADWYAGAGVEPRVESLSWGRESWFEMWQKEHRACREGVILMDMSFMSKFHVEGPGAGRLLNRLSTANVDGPSGEITYTQWLNSHGTLEADLTVTKLGKDKFMVVASDNAHRHVQTWMERNISADEGEHVAVVDVTGAFAQINIQGPRSRELLSQVTNMDVTDAVFPFRAVRELPIGYARVLCARITYLGELGYELYVPTEQAVHVYDRLVAVGEERCGLVHAGLKALASLRMEKGYRDYGHDIDNTDTLLEAGLGFTCDMDKELGFIGRDKVLEQKKSGLPLSKRLVQVQLLDPEPLMHHAEIVYRNGKIVGDIRAASYGHTVGGAVGLTMVEHPDHAAVNKKWLDEGKWEVDIAGTRFPALASLRPLYDPKSQRVKM